MKNKSIKRKVHTVDMKSKIESVIEGIKAIREESNNNSKMLKKELTQEIELLKTVVHSISANDNYDGMRISRLSDKLKENNILILETNKKIDNILKRLDDSDSSPIPFRPARIS